MKPIDEKSGVITNEAGGLVDCWNRIGVTGDGSCTKLAEVIHCRNCEVYSGARAQLLDRTPPPGYQRDWTEQFSKAKPPVAPGKISVLIFRVGAEWLALSTRAFHEVVEKRPVHSLPHRQNGVVMGLVNFRGELVICVSLAGLLGISGEADPQKSSQPHRRLMVVEWEGNFLAFPVDEIHGIHRYHPDELKNLPATVSGSASALTHGILVFENRTIGCLDEERLFPAINRSLA